MRSNHHSAGEGAQQVVKVGCVPERICGPWHSGRENSKDGSEESASSDPQRDGSRDMRHGRLKHEKVEKEVPLKGSDFEKGIVI